MPEPVWGPPPAAPVLAPGEVHVWRAPLHLPPPVLARLAAALDPDERARAARRATPRLRDEFAAGRALQRDILARYLRVPPAALAYRFTPHDKPELAGAAAASGVRFNVSNAGAMALYALTLHREIGVDVEALKPMPDAMDIATRFFSAPENAVFARLPEAERERAFFTCWTRKEAYVKAVGEGLSMPLACFDVTFTPDRPAALLETRGRPEEASRWTLHALEPGEGYVGALCVEGPVSALRLYEWTTAG